MTTNDIDIDTGDLAVEGWPDLHARLVEELCTVRPGLRPEQAHAALQGLRTLRWALHPAAEPCTPAVGGAACTATATGMYGTTLGCVLTEHADPWHDNGHGTRWQEQPGGVSAIHGTTPREGQRQ